MRSKSGNGSGDSLVKLSRQGRGLEQIDLGLNDVFGLASSGKHLIAFSGTKLYRVDVEVGQTEEILDVSGTGLSSIYGATESRGCTVADSKHFLCILNPTNCDGV